MDAASLFSETSALAAGSEVHRALAEISWVEDGLPDVKDLPASVALLVAGFLETQTASGS